VRGKPTGRLLLYDPMTDVTSVLVSNLHFANGVAVNADETAVFVAETFGVHLLRYDLKDGTLSTVVANDQLPGYLDGVDCDWHTSNSKKCYAVMPSLVVPVHTLWNALPSFLSRGLRTLLMALPRILAPPVKKFGGIVEYDPSNASATTRLLLDPTGREISMLTGATVHQGKLYLGSLQNDYIGVYDLSS